MALVDREARTFVLAQPSRDADVERRWATIPLDDLRTPFHEVLERRELVFVDRDRRQRDFAHMVGDTDMIGLDTTAALPLFDDDGTVFGVIGVGWEERTPATEQNVARLKLLADMCGQALLRSRRGEARANLIHDLQGEVLGAHDVPGGLDVAVAYRPANTELGFGGDWYDVITVDDERAVFVVGDVAGHGTFAAARMTATKATIRAFLTAHSLEDVVPRSTQALSHLQSGYIATVALAAVDRTQQRLRWCLAGHPPPVLRTTDGVTRLLDGAHHPPIGMPTTTKPLPEADFPPGSLLVLYTDGLVERRDADIDERLEVLRTTIAELPDDLDAAAVRDELLGRLADGAGRADDIAVVVIRDPG